MVKPNGTAALTEAPPPPLRELFFVLGRAFLYHNRFLEAAPAFEQALKEEGPVPDAYDILLQLGSAYERAGNGEGAVRAYLRAAAGQPQRVEEALPPAAKLLTPEIARAVAAWVEDEWWPGLQQAGLTGTGRVQVLLFLGKLNTTAENHARALEHLKQAAALAGDDADLAKASGEALYDAGIAFLNRNELAPAVEALRLANQLRPDHMLGYWYLVDALRLKSSVPDAPYVSKEEIHESLEVWEKAVARQRPGKRNSWAYLARALVNEQLSLIPGTARWTLGWEALCYCERALVLSPDDALHYAHLARWYRFLGLEPCQNQATAEGVRCDEYDQTALEERIIFLANTGRHDELMPLLEKRRKIDQSTWTDAIEAFARVRQGSPEIALQLIDKAIKDLPNLLWCREVRAECYRKLGQKPEADKDYAWIWERYNPEDVDGQSNYGRAALRLGLQDRNVDSAIDIFSRIAEGQSFPNDADTPMYLGLCWLVKGDGERGRRLLSDGIKRCRNRLQLDDLLKTELFCLEEAAQSWPRADGDGLRKVLNEGTENAPAVKAEVEAQLKEISEHPRSSEEELQQMLETRPADDAGGWLRAGVRGGCARLLAAAGRSLEAEDIYRQLLKEEPVRFPEAGNALMAISEAASQAGENRFVEGQFEEGKDDLLRALRIERDLGRFHREATLHLTLGDCFLKAGMTDQALEQYVQGLEAAQQAGDGNEVTQGDAQSRIGYIQLKLGKRGDAEAHFRAAFDQYRSENPDAPGAEVGACLRNLISSFREYWELDDDLNALADEVSLDTPLRANLVSYLNALDGPGTPESLTPTPTPVVLDISDVLVPFVDPKQDKGKFINELSPAMRDRIRADTGASVPGVLGRPNDALAPGMYEIQLDEVPTSRGQAVLDHWYFNGPLSALAEVGIQGHVLPTTHPVTGEPGCWLDNEGQAMVAAAGKQTWSIPEFLLAHVDTVLRRNMPRFVGVQETARILEEWEKRPGGKEQVQAALPTPLARRRFVWLIKALLADRVPILDEQAILAAAKELDVRTAPLPDLLRAARLHLRQSLPGNVDATTRLALPSNFEDQLLGISDGHAFLAAEPGQRLLFLAWLRGEMAHRDSRTVLVTRSPALRPLLRRLVEVEFPDLMVLAEEEVLSANTQAVTKTASVST